jgi:hypothetical protein
LAVLGENNFESMTLVTGADADNEVLMGAPYLSPGLIASHMDHGKNDLGGLSLSSLHPNANY